MELNKNKKINKEIMKLNKKKRNTFELKGLFNDNQFDSVNFDLLSMIINDYKKSIKFCPENLEKLILFINQQIRKSEKYAHKDIVGFVLNPVSVELTSYDTGQKLLKMRKDIQVILKNDVMTLVKPEAFSEFYKRQNSEMFVNFPDVKYFLSNLKHIDSKKLSEILKNFVKKHQEQIAKTNEKLDFLAKKATEEYVVEPTTRSTYVMIFLLSIYGCYLTYKGYQALRAYNRYRKYKKFNGDRGI